MDNYPDYLSPRDMRDADERSLRTKFADPYGRSALRAGKRVHPCPTCGRPNSLTAADVKLGYQCDRCADALEGGMEY